MKLIATSGYTFAPLAGTLDVGGVSGCTPANLLAAINAKAGTPIYTVATAGLGYTSVSGTVLTLQAVVATMAASDPLLLIFDDGSPGAKDSSLQSILAKLPALVSGRLPVDIGADDVGVVLASGASVIGKVGLQVGGTDIATGNPIPVAVVSGGGGGGGGGAVTIIDGGIVTLGSEADATATADTGNFSLVALIKRSLARWTALLAVLPSSLGAKASIAAFPVVLATDQTSVTTKIDQTTPGTTNKISLGNDSVFTIPQIGGAAIGPANRLPVALDPSQYPAQLPGQTTMAQSQCVAIASDQTPVPIYTRGSRPSASFPRQANTTAYSIGQVVGPSPMGALAFTAAPANDAPFTIGRVKLFKSSPGVNNASFRLHLYRNLPSTLPADAATWLTNHAEWLGDYDFTMSEVFSDGAAAIAGSPNAGPFIEALPAAGTQFIYGVLEARAAYTPVSAEVFTAWLEIGW